MLIEINGVDGQYASINPAYVVWANVYERSAGGWVAAVRCSTGSDMRSAVSNVFGPFDDKADADDIVRRVTEAANEVCTAIYNPDAVESPVERESEFVEFVNGHMTRAAVRRDSILSVQIVPPSDYAVWAVNVNVGGVSILSQGFDTSLAADELFDRLTQ